MKKENGGDAAGENKRKGRGRVEHLNRRGLRRIRREGSCQNRRRGGTDLDLTCGSEKTRRRPEAVTEKERKTRRLGKRESEQRGTVHVQGTGHQSQDDQSVK